LKVSDVFENVDSLYLSVDNARRGLTLENPGGKPSREIEVVEMMVKAARKGVDTFYGDLVAHEWYVYMDRMEAVLARLKPPSFSEPPLPPEGVPSEAWKRAGETKAGAQRYFDLVHSPFLARREVREKFGPAVDKTFYENPRDAVKVSMVMELLRNAFDNGYGPPQAAELALLAVAIGLESPMRHLGDPDGGDNRRARWQQTLNKAVGLMQRDLGPGYTGK
jgi:hypothetical protein